MLITKICTTTYSEEVASVLAFNIINSCEDDEQQTRIARGIVYSNDDVVLNENEVTYFIGNYEDTNMVIEAIKETVEMCDGLLVINSIEIGNDEAIQLAGYKTDDIQWRIQNIATFRDYVLNNLSKDVVLDKMLETNNLSEFDKLVLNR